MSLAKRLAALALLVAAAGCGRASAAAPSAAAPATKQVVAIVDVSRSIDATRRQDADTLLRSVVWTLAPGDRLVVIETYRANDPTAEEWSVDIPSAQDPSKPTPGEKRRADRTRDEALAVIPTFFDSSSAKRAKTTDIMSALFRAADQAKARPRAKTLVLVLSDMLNSTPELNMERSGGIPDDVWIQSLKGAGRLPDLSGLCVFAVGGDVASDRGARVRSFWLDYLRSSGAVFGPEQYRRMVSSASELRC